MFFSWLTSLSQKAQRSVCVRSGGLTPRFALWTETSPRCRIAHLLSNSHSFVANGAARFLTGYGSKQHAQTDSDANAGQQSRGVRPSAAVSKFRCQSFPWTQHVVRVITLAQHTSDRGQDGSICGQQADLQGISNPILRFIISVSNSHMNFPSAAAPPCVCIELSSVTENVDRYPLTCVLI